MTSKEAEFLRAAENALAKAVARRGCSCSRARLAEFWIPAYQTALHEDA